MLRSETHPEICCSLRELPVAHHAAFSGIQAQYSAPNTQHLPSDFLAGLSKTNIEMESIIEIFTMNKQIEQLDK